MNLRRTSHSKFTAQARITAKFTNGDFTKGTQSTLAIPPEGVDSPSSPLQGASGGEPTVNQECPENGGGGEWVPQWHPDLLLGPTMRIPTTWMGFDLVAEMPHR